MLDQFTQQSTLLRSRGKGDRKAKTGGKQLAPGNELSQKEEEKFPVAIWRKGGLIGKISKAVTTSPGGVIRGEGELITPGKFS
ncbi:hypothetical protein CEXT_453551 [Caerostris extrusa]|uniref:Uncharacterized protein n=1 Tax=Caerostris extrusa TaxID=172846 RepID=A0AAV4ND53_CAEEX|nr:hypothetical protein CEXT_453551 [Caerostris extrusa]